MLLALDTWRPPGPTHSPTTWPGASRPIANASGHASWGSSARPPHANEISPNAIDAEIDGSVASDGVQLMTWTGWPGNVALYSAITSPQACTVATPLTGASGPIGLAHWPNNGSAARNAA